MSATHLLSSSTLGKSINERQLLQIDQKAGRYRWLTCFALMFKRSRSKSPTSCSIPETLPLDSSSWSDDEDGRILSEKPNNYPCWSSLPSTPISSLSPPPRHSMVRQSRTRSLTPLDTLPPPPSRQRRRATLPVLRLSLNVDQRLSTHSLLLEEEDDPASQHESNDDYLSPVHPVFPN